MNEIQEQENIGEFKGVTCKGALVFGTACGDCERCELERSRGAQILSPQDKEEDKKSRGRPTLYTPELCDKVDEYLKECEDEEYDWKKSESETQYGGGESWEHRIRVKLPTIDGFAKFIGVARSTVFEWKELYSEFSDSLEKINLEQKERLLNKGLSGDYNPTIAKLVLSANHGLKEKTETEIEHKGSIAGFNFIRNDGKDNTNNQTNN